MELGEIVSAYRKQLGMSIDDLAEKSGVPVSTIKKISAGITKDPQLETVRAIAYALGCTLDDLDPLPSAQKLTSDEYAHVRNYRSLDGHGREAVNVTLSVELKRMLLLEEESKRKGNSHSFRAPEERRNIIDWLRSDLRASAGFGEYLDEESFHTIRVDADKLPVNADFGVIVSGDSMEPAFYEGDTVMVSKHQAEKGGIGLFIHEGEGFVKKYGNGELVSLNAKYHPIPMNESTRNAGAVIGVLDPSWIVEG